jgi:hypothetical protein
MFGNRTRLVAPAAVDVSTLPVSMYVETPSGEITLEEFERFAIDRIQGEL